MASEIDVTKITRIIACQEPDFPQVLEEQAEYKEYTLFLVNNGARVEDSTYSDLYYGERKVTDLFVTDVYPDSPEYPNDKIYLQPVLSEEVWEVGGQQVPTPVGYNIYFKHDGILTPVTSSIITNVQYDSDTSTVNITWNTEGGVQFVTPLLTEESLDDAVDQAISNISGSTAVNLANTLYPTISSKIENDYINPLNVRIEQVKVKWGSI